ncbi:MAG: hypothetical protein ABW022_23490 [Actinoplanes sp.]
MALGFHAPNARRYTDAALVLVPNIPYHLRQISDSVTRPRLDTGRLGILAAPLAQRTVRRYPDIQEWAQPSFEIQVTAPVPVRVVGEALALALVAASRPAPPPGA